MLRDPTSDQWVKRWCEFALGLSCLDRSFLLSLDVDVVPCERSIVVLRRPYLYIYEDGDEVREVGVINLGNVHVDSNLELESMLQVSPLYFLVWVLYTFFSFRSMLIIPTFGDGVKF